MFDSFLTTPLCGDSIQSGNLPAHVVYGSPSLDLHQTNFLGGVKMAPALSHDVYSSVKMEEYKNTTGLKNTGIAIGTVLVGSVILGKFSKLGKGFAQLFKSSK